MSKHNTENSQNIFKDLSSKKIESAEDAEQAIKDANAALDTFFNVVIDELSSFDAENPSSAQDVLSVLERVKGELSDVKDTLSAQQEELNHDSEFAPTEDNISEALSTLGPDVERSYNDMMSNTKSKIEKLKKTLAEKLNLSEEELASLSEENEKAASRRSNSHMSHRNSIRG